MGVVFHWWKSMYFHCALDLTYNYFCRSVENLSCSRIYCGLFVSCPRLMVYVVWRKIAAIFNLAGFFVSRDLCGENAAFRCISDCFVVINNILF